jgi:hypothetical protein
LGQVNFLLIVPILFQWHDLSRLLEVTTIPTVDTRGYS